MADELSADGKAQVTPVWLPGVCLLGELVRTRATTMAQETVVALDPAVAVASEVADTEERRHLEETATPISGFRQPKPSSPVPMPDDWCGPLWLRPPISAA